MNETIAAVSTAPSAGGIGIVRISGKDARAVAQRVFVSKAGKKITDAPGYTALYGNIFDNDVRVDEAIALIFAAPKSYTGEDVVELSCHGGMYVVRTVLRLVLANGARMAQPGEFTRRAYENGKLSLTAAEAVMDIISAKGENAAKCAAAMHDGALFKKINSVKEQILSVNSHIAAWVDYPQEDIPEIETPALIDSITYCADEISSLIGSFDSGAFMRRGVNTVIAGRPNVGKSTLMNMLCKNDMSIVTDVAGTTRDVVTAEVMLNDLPLCLSDTAGLCQTSDEVERFGIERAKKRMEQAELILAVFDACSEINGDDLELIKFCKGKRAVAVINKSDLISEIDGERLDIVRCCIPETVIISAKTGGGERQLYDAVCRVLNICAFDPSQAILSNERQLSCAKTALNSLNEAINAAKIGVTLDAVSVCLEDALSALMELTGERVTNAVADSVFHSFCVGK